MDKGWRLRIIRGLEGERTVVSFQRSQRKRGDRTQRLVATGKDSDTFAKTFLRNVAQFVCGFPQQSRVYIETDISSGSPIASLSTFFQIQGHYTLELKTSFRARDVH